MSILHDSLTFNEKNYTPFLWIWFNTSQEGSLRPFHQIFLKTAGRQNIQNEFFAKIVFLC